MAARNQKPVELITQEEREALNRAIEMEEKLDALLESQNVPAVSESSSAWESYAQGVNAEMSIVVCRAATAHRGKESRLMRIRSSELTPEEVEDHIQATYGSGEYRIRGYLPGIKGAVFNIEFVCEDLPGKPDLLPARQETQPMRENPMESLQNSMIVNMMNMQMQMMQGMAGLFANLAQPQKGPDILEIMRVMREMNPTPAPVTDPLALLKEGMSLAKEVMGGGSDRETNALDVVKDLLNTAGPVISQALQQAQQRQPAPAPDAPMPTAPRPAALQQLQAPAPKLPPRPVQEVQQPPAPVEPAALIPETPEKRLLDALHAFRTGGVTPFAAADMIQSQLTDDELFQVIEFFDDVQWLPKLMKHDARFQGADEWLAEAAVNLMQYVSDVDENADAVQTGTIFDASAPETQTDGIDESPE